MENNEAEISASVDFYDYRVRVVAIGQSIEFQVIELQHNGHDVFRILHTSSDGYGDTGFAMKAGIKYLGDMVD